MIQFLSYSEMIVSEKCSAKQIRMITYLQKIQQYLDTLLNSSDLQDSVRVSDNEMLNSIFCHYIKICHDKHIKFRADIRTNLLQKLGLDVKLKPDYTLLTKRQLNGQQKANFGIL